jgi:hypothetical protein
MLVIGDEAEKPLRAHAEKRVKLRLDLVVLVAGFYPE